MLAPSGSFSAFHSGAWGPGSRLLYQGLAVPTTGSDASCHFPPPGFAHLSPVFLVHCVTSLEHSCDGGTAACAIRSLESTWSPAKAAVVPQAPRRQLAGRTCTGAYSSRRFSHMYRSLAGRMGFLLLLLGLLSRLPGLAPWYPPHLLPSASAPFLSQMLFLPVPRFESYLPSRPGPAGALAYSSLFLLSFV